MITNFESTATSFDFKDATTSNFHNVAFHTLKIAIKAYFNTYNSVLQEIEKKKVGDIDTIKENSSYFDNYIETIVHFQHFFELIIKDILEKEDPLLVIDAYRKPLILHKLIKKEDITEEEYSKIFLVEFSDALTTICELLKEKRISSRFQFINANKNSLVLLNKFRNRVWHRGKFILKYYALDEFVCRMILPLVLEVVQLSEYAIFKDEWYYLDNQLSIDPIQELINEFNNKTPDYSKVALLKELGRAGYNYKSNTWLGEEIVNEMFDQDAQYQLASSVVICPVCGRKSLICYADLDYDYAEIGDEMSFNFQVMQIPIFNEYLVKCANCDFTVNKFVKNTSSYGYSNFVFWE